LAKHTHPNPDEDPDANIEENVEDPEEDCENPENGEDDPEDEAADEGVEEEAAEEEAAEAEAAEEEAAEAEPAALDDCQTRMNDVMRDCSRFVPVMQGFLDQLAESNSLLFNTPVPQACVKSAHTLMDLTVEVLVVVKKNFSK
jgi:hypothetical protein